MGLIGVDTKAKVKHRGLRRNKYTKKKYIEVRRNYAEARQDKTRHKVVTEVWNSVHGR